jgi:hypothetical protein
LGRARFGVEVGSGLFAREFWPFLAFFIAARNQSLAQVFVFSATFRLAASHQFLDTLPLDKPAIVTQSGISFMRHNRVRKALSASTLVAAAGLAVAPAAARTPYDGLWNVTIVTKTGSCEPSTHSTLTVEDGKISASGANISGSIGRQGLVRVSINGAYANGQLSGNAGRGKWNGASAGVPCSGQWEASRQ